MPRDETNETELRLRQQIEGQGENGRPSGQPDLKGEPGASERGADPGAREGAAGRPRVDEHHEMR